MLSSVIKEALEGIRRNVTSKALVEQKKVHLAGNAPALRWGMPGPVAANAACVAAQARPGFWTPVRKPR